MATQDKVANRYAKAIFDAIKNDQGAGKTLKELEGFARLAEASTELKTALESALFASEQKRLIVEDLAKKMGLSPMAASILAVVAESKRIRFLPAILKAVQNMLLQARGMMPIQVATADPVSDGDREKIEKKFEKILGKKVEASYEVDSSLIAGLRVNASGKTYDGSLAGWLDNLEENLAGGSI